MNACKMAIIHVTRCSMQYARYSTVHSRLLELLLLRAGYRWRSSAFLAHLLHYTPPTLHRADLAGAGEPFAEKLELRGRHLLQASRYTCAPIPCGLLHPSARIRAAVAIPVRVDLLAEVVHQEEPALCEMFVTHLSPLTPTTTAPVDAVHIVQLGCASLYSLVPRSQARDG